MGAERKRDRVAEGLKRDEEEAGRKEQAGRVEIDKASKWSPAPSFLR
jgi:hypothetical protein